MNLWYGIGIQYIFQYKIFSKNRNNGKNQFTIYLNNLRQREVTLILTPIESYSWIFQKNVLP